MPDGLATCRHMIPEIDERQFQARVLNAGVPVLVDFTTTWCGPCRALTPILDQLAASAAGRFAIVKVDGDASPALAAQYGVRAFPTLVVFHAGREVARHTGLASATRIKALLASAEAA